MSLSQDPKTESGKAPATRTELYIGLGILLIGLLVALLRSC